MHLTFISLFSFQEVLLFSLTIDVEFRFSEIKWLAQGRRDKAHTQAVLLQSLCSRTLPIWPSKLPIWIGLLPWVQYSLVVKEYKALASDCLHTNPSFSTCKLYEFGQVTLPPYAPEFPYASIKDNSSTYLTGYLWGLNEMICVRSSAPCFI